MILAGWAGIFACKILSGWASFLFLALTVVSRCKIVEEIVFLYDFEDFFVGKSFRLKVLFFITFLSGTPASRAKSELKKIKFFKGFN